MGNPFQPAERRQAYLKIALTGPSGSGKTLTALALSAGMVSKTGKIAVIDTENRSASLYKGDVVLEGRTFDVLEIDPPYTVEKYLLAIKAAVENGYEVLIVDSISHVWDAEGGLLAQKNVLDVSGRGNGYVNWRTITVMHEKLKAWLLHSDIHMICTMRSKQDHVQQRDSQGNVEVKKVGMAPIQRPGMEYEFTVVLDLTTAHYANASKDRCRMPDGRNLFDGRSIEKPGAAIGRELMAWRSSGDAAAATEAPLPSIEDPMDETIRRQTERARADGTLADPPSAPWSSPAPPPGPSSQDVVSLLQRLGINKPADQLKVTRGLCPGLPRILDLTPGQIGMAVDRLTEAVEDPDRKAKFLDWYNRGCPASTPALPGVAA